MGMSEVWEGKNKK